MSQGEIAFCSPRHAEREGPLNFTCRCLAALFPLLLSLSLTACGSISAPLPQGVEGPAAEALADRLLSAVNAEAFARAEGARWCFRDKEYLWHRGLGRLRITVDDEETIYIDLQGQRGWVLEAGQRPSPADEAAYVADAIQDFNNDSFWVFAPFKVRDPGTSRSLVIDPESQQRALLVFYETGGSTPGDYYLWYLDEEGRPERWAMWVSIVPIGGVESSWAGWKQTQSGAWVSTEHALGLGLHLRIPELEITTRFEALGVDAPRLLGRWPDDLRRSP